MATRARSVMGFDVSPVAVDQARAAAGDDAHGHRARFEVAGAEALPLENASIDLAFGNSVLHHLELEPAVREMARYFTEARFEFFNLASLAAVLVAGRPWFPGVLSALERFDEVVMGAVAPLRYQAWVCVIVLQGPRPGCWAP